MKSKISKKLKGFTLIELLVVIAIIAILAIVVVLTLNPAQLLAEARDSSRVSDFATLKSSIGLYEADVSSTNLGVYGTLYANSGATGATTTPFIGGSSTAEWGFATSSVNLAYVTSTSRVVNGNGWLPVNFGAISSGAPIGSLPQDPTNGVSGGTLYVYTYVASGTVYKLAAKIESQKYGYGGSNDIVSTDGGDSTSTYEQGTLLSL